MRTEQWGQDEVQCWLHPRDDRRPKRWVIVSPSEVEEEQNIWNMWESSLPDTSGPQSSLRSASFQTHLGPKVTLASLAGVGNDAHCVRTLEFGRSSLTPANRKIQKRAKTQ